MKTAICISTYKRPAGLKALLDSVQAMDFDHAKLIICVADNDAAGNEGYDLINKTRGNYSFPIFCEIEEKPGISHARNKSLSIAKAHKSELSCIAVTDDDVIVSPGWLREMINTAQEFSADVVAGRQEIRLPPEVPADITKAILELNSLGLEPAGTPVNDGSTASTLFSTRIFDDFGYAPFDPALSLTGGEDSDFFARIHQKNYKIVTCPSAVVFESYPQSRINHEWVLTRCRRSGAIYAYILKKYSGLLRFACAALRKLIRLPLDLIRVAFTPTLANKAQLQNTLGYLNYAFLNRIHEEYRR